MPQVNLSDISGPELRQLLDSSRRRGDAALSYKILQEMAARREAPAKRRPAEPRLVAVELGEPAEADDLPPMPNWRPPAPAPQDPAPEPPALEAVAPRPPRRSRRPAPPAAAETLAEAVVAPPAAPAEAAPPRADRPLNLRDEDPPTPPGAEAADRADAELRLLEARPPRGRAPRPPGPPRSRLAAGLALGVPIGILLGWGSVWFARDALWPPAAPAAAPVQTAALASSPAPPAPIAAAPAPEAEPPPAVAPPAADVPAAPASPSEASSAEPDSAAAEAAPAPRSPEAAPETVRPAAARGCATAPTPADRTICGDPELLRLQAELRRAYNAALEAHEDRALLRERQLAWRDARSEVSDPERLARLYEARIRKLNAATAEARRAR